MENLRIGIVGNIGVGKSSLVEAATTHPLDRLLLDSIPDRGDHIKVHCFKEIFDPKMLDAFYKDPRTRALAAQLEFFNGRIERERKINETTGIILEDVMLSTDYHVYGKAQRILGNMTDAEFLAYQHTYRQMAEKVRHPDLIVYLRAEVPVIMERINRRGRESEKTISSDYISTLNMLYEEYVARQVQCPVMIVDANEEKPDDAEAMFSYHQNILTQVADRIRSSGLRITTPGLSKWVMLPQAAATLRALDIERRLEAHLNRNPSLITIAGNVGLGKSTLAAIMERSLKIKAIYENPEKNPLLEKFLADKATYCYDLQMHFLSARAAQRIHGKTSLESYVKDRSLPEDILVFCHQFRQDGYLTPEQLDSLTCEFRRVNSTLPQADLMVILQAPADIAWQRIQQRGREMEIQGGWSKREIESLQRWYDEYPKAVKRFGFHTGPTLEVDVKKLDLTNRVHTGYIFEKMYELLTQRQIKTDEPDQDRQTG